MPRLSPFRGLVFDTAVSGPLERVTAPPYDVISDQRRLDYLRASPFTVVHLDLADGPHDPSHPDSRYANAARLIGTWERQGVIRRSEDPRFYAYEMSYDLPGSAPTQRLSTRGLICAMDLEDWGGSVLPHEDVREAPVADRLALLRATRTHLSAVYVIAEDDQGRLEASMAGSDSLERPMEVVDEQDVRHRMWPVPDGTQVRKHLERLEHRPVLIADGHHRYATALRYREERRRIDGDGSWSTVMTLVVDSASDRLPVMPFHRVQLTGDMPAAEGDPAPGLDETLRALRDEDLTIGTISMGAEGAVEYRVRHLHGRPPTVRALHDELLDDLAASSPFRYTADPKEADEDVRRGSAVGAYLLPPTTPGRIKNVAERGELLPPKSTYFWPKPRTGMVMMPLDLPPTPGPSPAPGRRPTRPSADRTG